jgi:hypothetical protein
MLRLELSHFLCLLGDLSRDDADGGDHLPDRGRLFPVHYSEKYFRLASHLVTKSRHAALVTFYLGQVQGNVPVELLEELNTIADQDR